MNNARSKIKLFCLSFIIINVQCFSKCPPKPCEQKTEPNFETAIQAYVYGYPLVTMEMTRRIMTNTVGPSMTRSPMSQFANVRNFIKAGFNEVTAPNADTLYSIAWLDLSTEPYILHIPDLNGRFFLMELLSGWTEVFASLGKRTIGTLGGDYAITGPNWHGILPKGIRGIKSPTNMVWILGRTYCTGTPEDYESVHQIQDQYSLIPLSSFGKNFVPPEGTVDQTLDMETAVRDQVNALNAQSFFSMLAQLMKDNPPAEEDSPIVKKLARLGIIPGQEFDIRKQDPKIAKALEKASKLGVKGIISFDTSKKVKNGWFYDLDLGQYGTRYLERAYAAYVGLGANLAQDAIYPITSVDSNGKPLTGKYKYVVHFNEGELPPVHAFWSLTMYDANYFFVDNPIDRYNINERDQRLFQINKDGSIDLFIQNTAPDHEKEPNWLPAPKGNFVLALRIYWPHKSALNGTWVPPVIKRVK